MSVSYHIKDGLLCLSGQAHASRGWCWGDGDVGCLYCLLVAVDVEQQGGTVLAYVDGHGGTHHQRQVHVSMTAGESAEHGDMILFQHLVQHGLHALVGELGAAVGELAEDDATAAVEHAVHLEDAHLAVDVVHRLFYFLNKEYQVLPLGGIGLRAEIGRKGAEVAAYEHATGLPP